MDLTNEVCAALNRELDEMIARGGAPKNCQTGRSLIDGARVVIHDHRTVGTWTECEHGDYTVECGREHPSLYVHGYAHDSLPGMRGGSYKTVCGMPLSEYPRDRLCVDARLWTCPECREEIRDDS